MAAGMAESSRLDSKANRRRKRGQSSAGVVLSPTLTDIPPPTRPHLLILPKQFCPLELEIKYSNLRADGGHSQTTTLTYFKLCLNC